MPDVGQSFRERVVICHWWISFFKFGLRACEWLRLSRWTFPYIAKAIADAGYAGDRPATATIITVDIVRKPKDQVGFAVHPPKWVVERFFGWISCNRRLWKDPEATLASAHAFLYAAAVMILVRRLGRAA